MPADQARDEHLVRPAEADRCRRPQCRLRRGRSRRWPSGHSSARLALRHSQLRRCRPVARVGRLPRDHSVSARLWHDALSFERHGPQRPAVGDCVDVIALMDALRIEKAILAGFDWGARTVNIVAALWPERCKAMVSVSGYLIGSQEAGKMPLPPKAELEWWYQYYFATERGRAGYEKYRREFSKLIWQIASPKWQFDDATFDRSAAAFDNPDHVAIVIHNYRWRLGLADGEPKYDELEKRLAAAPGHHGAHHHPRRRCQWRAAPGAELLCQEVLRQIRAPAPSPAASGTTCRRKRRRPLPRPSSTSPQVDRPVLARRMRQI